MVPDPIEPQEEGASDRQFYGIDGTMGDAQDKPHPFVASLRGPWCAICGLAHQARVHHRRPRDDR